MSNSPNTTVLDRFLLKLGTLLTMTKDALLEDFLGDLPSYFPTAPSKVPKTYDELKSQLSSAEGSLSAFISHVFERLGYDLSNFQNNQKLYDLVSSILTTVDSIGTSIKDLADEGIDWDNVRIVQEEGEDGPAKFTFDGLFTVSEGEKHKYEVQKGGFSASVSFGDVGGGKLEPLFNLFSDLFDLIGKFRALEWDSIGGEAVAFGSFVEDTFFNKEFAERLFDHILIVLLRNAKTVFDEEIREVAQNAKELKNLISQTGQEIRKGIENEIKKLQDELKKLEKQILEAAADARDELLAEYNRIRRELDKLLHEALGDFGRVGEILDRIYQVLDFLGLIGKQTIEVAKFVKDPAKIPTPDLSELDGNLAKAFQDSVNSEVADANALIKDAVSAIREQCPTVEIYVLRWSRVARMFTDPAGYFPEQFPVKDYDDAAALVTRIYALVKAFNPDIPDFSSVGALIDDLIALLKRELEKGANAALNKVKEAVNQFIEFLKEIKKAVKTYADAIRKEVENGIKEGSKFLEDLKKGILDEASSVLKKAKETGHYIWKETGLAFWTFQKQLPGELVDYMRPIFLDPLVKVTTEKAKEHDLFKEIDPALWEKAWNDEVTKAKNGGNTILSHIKDEAGKIESYVTQVFSPTVWEKKVKSLVSDIQQEFKSQTGAISGIIASEDSLKQYGKSQVDLLLSGKGLDNPFSALNPAAYLSIVSDHVKAMIPSDLDGFFPMFRDAVEKGFTELIGGADAAGKEIYTQGKAVCGGAEAYAAKVKAFADDVFVSYWAALKESVWKTVIRPFQAMVERTVRQLLRDLIRQVVDEVKKALAKVISNKELNQVVQGVTEAAKEAAALAAEILELKEEAGKVSCWEDSLHFAVRVYRAIPQPVKEAVKDLVDLPDLSGFFDDVSLPDYKLDLDGKFLSVNFYQSEAITAGLVAYVGQRKDKEKKDADGNPLMVSGVYLLPVIQHKLNKQINLGSSHMLTVATAAGLDPKKPLGLFFAKPAGFDLPTVDFVGSEKSVSANLTVKFERGQINQPAKKLYLYGSEDKDEVLSITLENYPQEVYLGYNGEQGFNAAYLGRLEGLNFILRLQNVNAFFEKILKGQIEFGLDKLELGYALKEREGQKKGLTIGGDAHVRIPLKPTINLKAVKLDNLALDLGTLDFRGLDLGINLNLTADLGPVTFTLPDLGFGLDFEFMTPDFRFGSLDVSPHFKFPDGFGIAIDIADVVKGAGVVKWDLAKGEFLGAFELSIIDLFSVGALFLLNIKKPDGSKGFSFMGAISFFFPGCGIPLGMGFSLTAIGASLGANRRIDTNRMRDAVYDGSLEAVMFVKDLENNLSTVLANMTSFYPVEEDHFFFGAMVQITWAQILNFTCGVFIQIPDPIIVIAGGVHLNIADAAEGLISMHSNFMGVFDVHKGIAFDAVLYDTKFVGIEFHGSVALRIYWAGDTKGFILSAGGFHPSYTPEPGFDIPDMQRIGYKMGCGPLSISNDVYLAVTSNTVQFGSDSRLKVGWDKYGLHGYMYFNVLFQFNPFRFMFDAGIGVAVKLFGKTLLSIDLYLEVSGPAQWHIAGKAKFRIIFTFHVNFSESWGKKQQVGEPNYVDLLPILRDEFDKDDNWTVVKNDLVDGLVITGVPENGVFAMNPSDSLSFSQEMFPLDTDLDKYGEATPNDAKRIKITEIKIDEETVEGFQEATTSFAPAQYQDMSDEDKLSSPSYLDMPSGFTMSANAASKCDLDAVKMTLADIDYNVQEEGMDWKKWTNYAKNNETKESAPKTVAAKASVDSVAAKTIAGKTPKKVRAKVAVSAAPVAMKKDFKFGRHIEKGKVRVAEDDKKGVVLVYRPAYRRDETGFNRYVAQLDRMMSGSVRGYVTKLEKMDNQKK